MFHAHKNYAVFKVPYHGIRNIASLSQEETADD